MRILLVEDRLTDARLMEETLRDVDIERAHLEHAATLAEALALLRGSTPDLVLLDLGLPDSEGIATLEVVRKASPDVAIVVLTGLDDPDTAIEAVRRGADDYLVKAHVRPENLARTLRHAVERREAHLREVRLIETIQRIGSSLAGELDLAKVVERVVGEAVAHSRAEAGLISCDDGHGTRLLAGAGWFAGLSTSEIAALCDAPGVFAFPRGPVTRDESSSIAWPTIGAYPRPRRIGRLCAPVRGATGGIAGVLVLLHSHVGWFTERDAKLAEGIASWASVAIANARAFVARDHAVAVRERILAVVSHDLRNPLGVVAQALELSSSDIPAIRNEATERGLRGVRHMSRLIGDLLDYSSIDANTLRLEYAEVDLAGVITEAVEAQRARAEDKHIRLEEAIDNGPHMARADRERLVQALGNLVSNALKFTPQGGRVRVGLARAPQGHRITVRDTGPGIPESERDMIFRAFFRGDQASREGAGLGLAITRGIVESHGGQLTLDADEGPGASFSIRLPGPGDA